METAIRLRAPPEDDGSLGGAKMGVPRIETNMTPREIVYRCLNFQNPPRFPREIWSLPWSEKYLSECLGEVRRRWPDDFGYPGRVYRPSPRVKGELYEVGEYQDEWGCRFVNLHWGIQGEVREPILPDLSRWREVRPPDEILLENRSAAMDQVNRDCADSDLFMCASACPRPWERLQFLRGTENAMADVMTPDDDLHGLLRRIHEFYLRELEFWVETDVDRIMFMDDWGSQTQLLIPPRVWRELFKPLYRDYADLAHAHGKKVFMHSDGFIEEIYPDLVEIGVDAMNSQLFVMDFDRLAAIARGKMTMWGELDRQHVLTSADPNVARVAVRRVARAFYDKRGGVIAQFEVTPGAQAATVIAAMEEWDAVAARS